ncbi:m-AAA protease-interacting protein 1, mitochondrial [Sardina pilchardus]|uniref:m-AAA protease-interacting protein 1, mitochondrial n=1 Tax=Sardina pilchardus TaxID=27697 RepID=UPI002E137C3A
MQRITCFATYRELGGIVGCKPLACPWKRNPPANQTPFSSWAFLQPSCRPLEGTPSYINLHLRRQNTLFVCQRFRQYSSDSDNEPKTSRRPEISVVGIPDPITWIRNKIIMIFVELYFDFNISSVEFDTGVKQAVVHVSTMVSKGRFADLRGVMSDEAVERVKRKYKTLSDVQKRNIAISSDDIVFVLPEDVSVIFDNRGRKFCYVMMRLWHLSDADIPEDPESTRIFSIEDTGEESSKKIVTAVYEFHRELTRGVEPDWTVTHIWHWKQLE